MRQILIVVTLGFAAWALWERQEKERALDQVQGVAFRADSVASVHDTTRAVVLPPSVIGDSMRVWERRVQQVRQRADSLDRALGAERVARYNVAGVVRNLSERIEAPVQTEADSVRRAEFSVDNVPYHLTAAVALPRAPATGSISVSVRLDTAEVEARVECGRAGDRGVRVATLAIKAPSWLSLRMTRLEQATGTCSPVANARRGFLESLRPSFGAGVGIAVANSGPLRAATVVGLFWRF